MKTIEESVVIAMDGSDKELFPFLPYILQDVWEIGADPDAIIKLIKKQFNNVHELQSSYANLNDFIRHLKLPKGLDFLRVNTDARIVCNKIIID